MIYIKELVKFLNIIIVFIFTNHIGFDRYDIVFKPKLYLRPSN